MFDGPYDAEKDSGMTREWVVARLADPSLHDAEYGRSASRIIDLCKLHKLPHPSLVDADSTVIESQTHEALSLFYYTSSPFSFL